MHCSNSYVFQLFQNGEGDGKEQPGVIDIVINNVVCSFSVGCHIDLREIAMTGQNVEYRREHGVSILSTQCSLKSFVPFEFRYEEKNVIFQLSINLVVLFMILCSAHRGLQIS